MTRQGHSRYNQDMTSSLLPLLLVLSTRGCLHHSYTTMLSIVLRGLAWYWERRVERRLSRSEEYREAALDACGPVTPRQPSVLGYHLDWLQLSASVTGRETVVLRTGVEPVQRS